MTGISPTCVSARSAVGSTASTSPTKPRSRPPGSRRGLAVTSSPSSPDRPTAMRPCRLSRPTRVLLMRPTSTMRTRSMVSASVTRWPSTNTGRLPSCSIARLISGPPPWTTTMSTPTYRSSATSSTKESRSAAPGAAWSSSLLPGEAGGVMAAPPYLMTTVWPAKRLIHCSASGGSRRELTRVPDSWARLTWCAPSTSWTPPLVTSSRRILRVEADVGGSQVGGAHRPRRSGAAQVQPQLDLAGGKGRAGVGTGRRTVAHQHHPLGRVLPGDPIHGGRGLDARRARGAADLQPHPRGVEGDAGGAGRLEDAAPIRVAAVDGRLDQRAVGHAPGHGDRGLDRTGPAHLDAEDLGAALGVGQHLPGEVVADRPHRLAQVVRAP